jgi:uncharacterized protein YodC (DUF2158 family)
MTFKIGDIVQLKSGGPSMTVTGLPHENSDCYETTWFWGEKYTAHYFPPASLKLEGTSE